MTYWARVLAGILLLAYCTSTVAQSPADAWQLGLQSFQQNDYAAALLQFEFARDAGQPGPAVHYNIGVCQYKLGSYSKAGNTFESLKTRFPEFVALAEYNLGLVAAKLDKGDEARRHFRRSYDLSADDETLRILSSEMLTRTTPDPAPTRTRHGAIGIRAGYDDNVALRDELGLPTGTTGDSPMTDIYASIDAPITDADDFRVDAGAYAVRYFDDDEFDQNVVRAGITYAHALGHWRGRIGVHGNYGTLGGDSFDKSGSLSIRVNRRLSQATSIGFRYRYDDISAAESVFSGIEGTRQKIEARYRWFSGDSSILAKIQLETNDRLDTGVSPDRFKLGFDYRYSPLSGWGYEAGVEFRSSDYDGLDPVRTEDLVTLKAGITRMLNENWLMLGEYYYSDNDSSDSTFSYDRNRITLSLIKIF